MHLEGNRGGDYIEIDPIEDNLVHLEVGHCCVVTIKQIVPVEFITATLTEAMLTHGTVKACIEATTWPEEFRAKLIKQIVAVA